MNGQAGTRPGLRLSVTLALALALAATAPPAEAHSPGAAASWAGPAPAGGVVELRLRTPDGTTVSTWVQDGGSHDRLTWRPDVDPAPGRVAVRWEELWLDAGPHRLEAWVPGESQPRWTHSFAAGGNEGTTEGRRTAATEHAVVGLRRSQGAHDGLSVSSPAGGRALVPGGGGTWDLATLAPTAATARMGPHTAGPALTKPDAPLDRSPSPQHTGLVRFGLLPAFAVSAAAVATLASRAGRLRGRRLAALLAVGCMLLVLGPVLAAPADRLLSTGWPVQDPVDSVALVAAIAADLPFLSGLGAAVQWPEGGDWLAGGPAALAALLVAPVTLLLGPIAGHNLGVGLGAGGLALAAWGLARVRGAQPGAALLAGAAAVLAPVIWDEWDALSLDRATLFTAPLTLLAVDLAALRGGRRRIVVAGALVGGAVYWQVYHSLFLGVLLPLLAAPLLLHRRGKRRLGRLLCVAGVAAAVAAPGLVALQSATQAPGGADTRRVGLSTLVDIAPQAGERALAEQAAAVAAGAQDPLRMNTAEQRLLSAASRSWSLDQVLWPRGLVVGGPLFLWLMLAAVGLARDRGRAARSVWEVGVLSVCALGPVVLWRGQWTGTAGPWLLGASVVPGFEQLKNVYRFGLLAAALSGVPLALLLDGSLRRLRLPRWAEGAAIAAVLVGVLGLHFHTERRGGVRVGLPVPGRTIDAGPALPDLAGPVVLVPHGSMLPPSLLLPALSADLPVVGVSPLEPGPKGLTPWRDENAFLNRLAVLSADRQTDRLVPGSTQEGARALAQAGVVGVAVRTGDLVHPSLLPAVEAVVGPVGTPVAGAPAGWRVWRLSPTGTGP